MIAGIAGVAALSGVIAYPYARQEDASGARSAEVVAKGATQVVAIAALTAVRERVPVTPPPDPVPALEALRAQQARIEAALAPIAAGLTRALHLMPPPEA